MGASSSTPAASTPSLTPSTITPNSAKAKNTTAAQPVKGSYKANENFSVGVSSFGKSNYKAYFSAFSPTVTYELVPGSPFLKKGLLGGTSVNESAINKAIQEEMRTKSSNIESRLRGQTDPAAIEAILSELPAIFPNPYTVKTAGGDIFSFPIVASYTQNTSNMNSQKVNYNSFKKGMAVELSNPGKGRIWQGGKRRITRRSKKGRKTNRK